MKSYKFYNSSGYSLADTNIAHGGPYASAVDFSDAILDAKSGKEMLENLSKLRLVGFISPKLDREDGKMARIVFRDGFGNVRYIEAVKNEEDTEYHTTYYKMVLGTDEDEFERLKVYCSMNGYKADFTNGHVYVSEDEVEELKTILSDEGCAYSFC